MTFFKHGCAVITFLDGKYSLSPQMSGYYRQSGWW